MGSHCVRCRATDTGDAGCGASEDDDVAEGTIAMWKDDDVAEGTIAMWKVPQHDLYSAVNMRV